MDSTQEAIVAALRGVGARVWIVGKEIDLVVYFRGRTHLMDCKSKRTRMTDTQKAMNADGWNIIFAHSPEEALYEIGATAYRIVANGGP